MTGEVLITRTAPLAGVLARRLEKAGFKCHIEPMLEIVPRPIRDWSATIGVQGVLLTSANALTAARSEMPTAVRKLLVQLPVLAVGDATANAARDYGFSDVTAGQDGAQALIGMAKGKFDPARGDLLHLAGAHLAQDLAGDLRAAGFGVRRLTIYEARAPAALSPALLAKLRAHAIAGALFFSARTVAHFVSLMAAAGEGGGAAAMTAYCLSQRVADAAKPLPWRGIEVASRADEDAMMDLFLHHPPHEQD